MMINMRLRDEFIYIVKSAISSMTFFIPGLNLFSVLYGFNLYKTIVSCCSNLKNRDSLKRLFFIVFGLILGYFATDALSIYLLDNFKFQIYLFFIGIIIGGIKTNNTFSLNDFSFKYLFIFALSLVFMFLMNNVLIENKLLFDISINNYILIFVIGLLCGISILIPGLGLSYLNNFVCFSSNILFDTILIIGIICGIYIICIFINKLFGKCSKVIDSILVGFLIANVIIIFLNINIPFDFKNIFSGILLFLWGYLLSINLEKE